MQATEQNVDSRNEILIKRGKAYLLLLFAFFLAIDIPLLIKALLAYDFEKILSTIIRMGLSVALFYFVYMGRSWARHLFTLLIALGMLGIIAASIGHGIIYAAPFLAGAAFFIYVVEFSAPVNALMKARKAYESSTTHQIPE